MLLSAAALRLGSAQVDRVYVGASLAWQSFNVLQLAPALWLDASDTATITASLGKVSQWDDKSGNLRHVTQGTSALQPSTGALSWNGRNVLSFAAQFLAHSSATPWRFMHDGTEWTALLVAQTGATGATNVNNLYRLFGTNAGGASNAIGAMLTWDDRSSQSRNNAVYGSVTNGGTAPVLSVVSDAWQPGAPHLVASEFRPSSAVAANRFRCSVDAARSGANTSLTAVSTAAATWPLQIGSAGAGDFPLTGAIAEVILVPRALTIPETTSVTAYLKTKWGTP